MAGLGECGIQNLRWECYKPRAETGMARLLDYTASTRPTSQTAQGSQGWAAKRWGGIQPPGIAGSRGNRMPGKTRESGD
jgi:hypothetical protein